MSTALLDPPATEVRPWDELVEAGRRAVGKLSSAQFELGDLALEAEPMSNVGVHTGALERLRQFSEEIGVTYQTLVTYRTVAAGWPPEQRESSLSWTAHKLLMEAPDPPATMREVLTTAPPAGGPLSEDRWTIRSIRELVLRRRAEAGVARSAPRTTRPRTAERPISGCPDAAVSLDNIGVAAVNVRAWVFGAELTAEEKDDLADRLDGALDALREVRKRLI